MENYDFKSLSKSGEITEEIERARKIARDRYYDRLYNADEDIYTIELKDFVYKYYGVGEGDDFRVEWGFDEDLERYVLEGIDPSSIDEYLIGMTYEDKDINEIWEEIIRKFPQIDNSNEKFHFHNSIMSHIYDKYIDIFAGGDTFDEDDMLELLFDLDKKYGLTFSEFPHETLRDLLKLYGDLPLKYLNRSFELYKRINIGIMEDMEYTNGNIIYALGSYAPARFNLDHLNKAQKDIDWFREQIKNYLEKNNKEASQLILENLEKFKYEEERLAIAMENPIETEKIIPPYEDKAKKIMMEVFEQAIEDKSFNLDLGDIYLEYLKPEVSYMKGKNIGLYFKVEPKSKDPDKQRIGSFGWRGPHIGIKYIIEYDLQKDKNISYACNQVEIVNDANRSKTLRSIEDMEGIKKDFRKELIDLCEKLFS